MDTSTSCSPGINNICPALFECSSIFIYFMFISLGIIIIGSLILSVLLYLTRKRYPISERSFGLSIFMCLSFAMTSSMYPFVYIASYYSWQFSDPLVKFVYMTGLYGLYLSYMARMARVGAALSNSISQVFTKEKTVKPWARFAVWILRRENLLILVVSVVSLLLAMPVLFSPEFYLLPYENYSSDSVIERYGNNGDFLTAYVFNFIVIVFLLLHYSVRNIPSHYGFRFETSWNLTFQWVKTVGIFLFNLIEHDNLSNWCSYNSPVNIAANVLQYFLIIAVSILPGLFRQRFKPDRPPFPDLTSFKEFIEQEDEDSYRVCNLSFIQFLKEYDQRTAFRLKISPYRESLNICEFYFTMKSAAREYADEAGRIEINNGYVEALEKIAEQYIFNPKNDNYRLMIPPLTFENLRGFKEELHYSLSINGSVNSQSNRFVQAMQDIFWECETYLQKTIFQTEFIFTEAWRGIGEYFEKQKTFQANLSLLGLLHCQD